MIFLADFSVMNPSFGLLFWTTIIFLMVLFVLSRFFKTIKDALKKREQDIDHALLSAEEAKREMAQIKDTQRDLERQAAEDRLKINREAEAIRDRIIEEAKTKAEELSKQMLESAKEEIENRQKEMQVHLMNEVGKMSVDIAQQIIQTELAGKHEEFVSKMLNDLKISSLN